MNNYDRQRFYDHVGQKIRDQRNAAGLTRPQLVTKLGIKESSLINAEAGHNCPFHLAAQIADELDCNLYDLIPKEAL